MPQLEQRPLHRNRDIRNFTDFSAATKQDDEGVSVLAEINPLSWIGSRFTPRCEGLKDAAPGAGYQGRRLFLGGRLAFSSCRLRLLK